MKYESTYIYKVSLIKVTYLIDFQMMSCSMQSSIITLTLILECYIPSELNLKSNLKEYTKNTNSIISDRNKETQNKV